jgi:uncharacterized membrane protein
MLMTQQAPQIAEPDLVTIHAPTVRAVIGRTVISLTVACFIPALLIYTSLVVFSISTAVLVALGWACGAIGWRWLTGRPTSALLFLTVAIMAVRTAFTLVTGNTYVYFIQPVFADALVATIFLASLLHSRPMVARLAADFYPMVQAIAARPRIRSLFRRLTLMWGLVIISKGTVTLYLLQTQSTVDFVLFKGIAIITLTSTAAAATIWMSALAVLKEHLLPSNP